jgi:hypothetical protein
MKKVRKVPMKTMPESLRLNSCVNLLHLIWNAKSEAAARVYYRQYKLTKEKEQPHKTTA